MECGLAMILEAKALMLLLRPQSEVDSISAQVDAQSLGIRLRVMSPGGAKVGDGPICASHSGEDQRRGQIQGSFEIARHDQSY